jgi:hypothetical protein
LSNIRAGTISGVNGTDPVTLTKQSAAKAWLQHNSSHAIQDSFNFSSISDGGTGLTSDATFTSAMTNNNYAISGCAGTTTNDDGFWSVTAIATTDFNVRCRTHNGNLNDSNNASLTVHGDLA